MNNETLNALVELEQDQVKNANSLDSLLDAPEKEKAMITLEKAQKLEHAERQLRLDESKQELAIGDAEFKKRLELEKFEYQKKRDKKDNIVKIIVGGVTATGTILVGIAKLIQIHISRKAIKEAYAIDQVTCLTSKTARDLLSSSTNPKI